MDPHAPYLPPAPYERMFYHGNETDKRNQSMAPVMSFKPFCDFFASWMPPGITDKEYMIAQYDGAVAYMDAAIRAIFTAIEARGLATTPSSSSTATTARRSTTTSATSITTACTSRRWWCR